MSLFYCFVCNLNQYLEHHLFKVTPFETLNSEYIFSKNVFCGHFLYFVCLHTFFRQMLEETAYIGLMEVNKLCFYNNMKNQESLRRQIVRN